MPGWETRKVDGLRSSFLGFGINLLSLGSGILEFKGSIWTLILWPRTTLARPFTLSHLSPLALVISLARPFGDLSRGEKGAWVMRGCSEEVKAMAAGGGSAIGALWISAG